MMETSKRTSPQRAVGPALEATSVFLRWLILTVEKFPRTQKFLLGDRIQSAAQAVLERLIEATCDRERDAATGPGFRSALTQLNNVTRAVSGSSRPRALAGPLRVGFSAVVPGTTPPTGTTMSVFVWPARSMPESRGFTDSPSAPRVGPGPSMMIAHAAAVLRDTRARTAAALNV